jgi:hypothetical protein
MYIVPRSLLLVNRDTNVNFQMMESAITRAGLSNKF